MLAELAEFVSRKKVAEQNVAAPAVEAKQDAQQNAEKERNTAGTGNEAGGAPVNDAKKRVNARHEITAAEDREDRELQHRSGRRARSL